MVYVAVWPGMTEAPPATRGWWRRSTPATKDVDVQGRTSQAVTGFAGSTLPPDVASSRVALSDRAPESGGAGSQKTGSETRVVPENMSGFYPSNEG